MDFERIATETINLMLSKIDGITPYINSGDREPSWDGNVYLNKEGLQNKENIIKIPVQVKSKRIKKDCVRITPIITYPVHKEDLNNYMNNGGTIFFVVYIDEITGDCVQIYYQSITPLKAREMLRNGKSKQKTYNLRFKQFPSSQNEIKNLLTYFHDESCRQISFVNSKKTDLKELISQGQVNSMTMTSDALWNGNIFEIPNVIEGHEITIYANTIGSIQIPIETCEFVKDLQIMTPEVPIPFSVNGVKYYDVCSINVGADKVKYNFGKCFSIVVDTNSIISKDIKKGTITFKLQGTLIERINALKCLIAIVQNGSVSIGGSMLSSFQDIISLDKYLDELNGLESLQRILSEMHVKKDLDFDNCDSGDLWRINTLISTVLYKKPVYGIKEELPMIFNYRISNITLLLGCTRHNDGSYDFCNFFGSNIVPRGFDEKDKKWYNVSKYSALKKDQLIMIDNLSFNDIIEEIKQIEQTPLHIEYTIHLCLEIIKAFDQNHSSEFLDAAKTIIEYLEEANPDMIENDVIMINKYQIYVRERSLSFEEKRSLIEMIAQSSDICVKTCGFILLNEHEEARKLLKNMEPKTLIWFMEFPIYTLYHESKNQLDNSPDSIKLLETT